MSNAEKLVRTIVVHVAQESGSHGPAPIKHHVNQLLATPAGQSADTDSLLIVSGTRLGEFAGSDFNLFKDNLVASLDGDPVVPKPRPGKTPLGSVQIEANTTIGELVNHLLT